MHAKDGIRFFTSPSRESSLSYILIHWVFFDLDLFPLELLFEGLAQFSLDFFIVPLHVIESGFDIKNLRGGLRRPRDR